VHLGSYPGNPCIVRLKGEAPRVQQAAAVVQDYLDDIEADPASSRLRQAWAERQRG
jgi:hypothetical protein